MVSKGECFVGVRASAVFVGWFKGPFGPISQDLGHSIPIGMACKKVGKGVFVAEIQTDLIVELGCDSNNATRFPLYLCINTR